MAPVARRCSVPRGKSIVVPIINTLAVAAPGVVADCEEIQRSLQDMNNSGTNLEFSANGAHAPDHVLQEIGTDCFM